jgi:hypothetical protein
MADTIAEYNQKLGKFYTGLSVKIFEKCAEYAGADLRAQITNRVIMTQTNTNEESFSAYSTNPILTSGHYIRDKKTKTDEVSSLWDRDKVRKLKKGYVLTGHPKEDFKWVTIKGKHLFEVPGGYAELRSLFDRSSNTNKSFDFSGQTWKEFNVTKKSVSKNGFKIRMGGTTKLSQNLINWNSEREGVAIIDPTQKEVDALCKRVDEWVLQFAKECGL